MTKEELQKRVAELETHLSSVALQERCEKQVREYRRHLEGLLDRTVRVMYVIGGFLVGAAALLGIKTYWDIDSRLEEFASSKVTEIVTDKYVKGEVAEVIQQYSERSAFAYYFANAAAPESHRYPLQFTEHDLARFDRIASDHTHEAFPKLLVLFGLYEDFADEYSSRYGLTIATALSDSLSGGGNDISSDVQKKMIQGLVELRFADAATLLAQFINHEETPLPVRLSLIESLADLTRRGDQSILKRSLRENLASNRSSQPRLYYAKLKAISMMDLELAAADLLVLSKSSSFADLKAVADIINEVFLEGTNPSHGGGKKVQEIIGEFLMNPLTDIAAEDSRFSGSDDTFPQPDLTIWIRLSVDQIQGIGSGIDDSRVMSRSFLAAAIGGLRRMEPSETERHLETVILPLVRYGQLWFAHEKRLGRIGLSADPFIWQDGFMVKLSTTDSTKEVPMLLSQYDSEHKELLFVYTQEHSDIKEHRLPIGDLRNLKIYTRRRSWRSMSSNPNGWAWAWPDPILYGE